jgi:hypothetical protein
MKLSSSTIAETFTFLEYVQEVDINPYSNSSLKLFQDMSSKKKGAAFEKLITEVLREKGYSVEKPKGSTDYDRLVNNKKVEIKGSMGWVTDGNITHYRFQQIRENQDYDIVMFAFFTPDEVIIKGCSKEVAMEKLSYQDEKGFYPHNQHGGKRVNSGTFCVDTLPNQLDWMVDIEELI